MSGCPTGTSTGSSPVADISLPSSLQELRALPVKVLKQAMARLGLSLTPGSEKEDLVQEIAGHIELTK